MDWKTLLAYISGSVDEELLLRNAYLVAENRILRDQIKGRVQLSDAERLTLSEIGRKPGKTSPRSSNLKRFSPGNANSPLTNLTAPPSANRPGVLVLRKN